MPQRAIKPPIIGPYSTLRGSIWRFISQPSRKQSAVNFAVGLGGLEKFVLAKKPGNTGVARKPCTTNDVLESGLITLVNIALQPEILMAIAMGTSLGKDVTTPNLFARLYATDPDFVLDVFRFVRRRWRSLGTTKATQLFQFIASNYYIQPYPHQKLRPINKCTDKEIASAFETSQGGKPVNVDDVVKARRKVARAVYQSLSVAKQFKLPAQPTNYLHGLKVECF